MPINRIEVTDLYSSFYDVAQRIWSEPDFRGQESPSVLRIGDYWYNVEAYLEENLFLAGCARRVYRATGRSLTTQEVHSLIRICDLEGNVRPGDSGQYYGSGFDWGKPDDDIVQPLVISGNMIGDRIGEFRLFVEMELDG